jgi:ParB/RepB/Spo0J family partition protein
MKAKRESVVSIPNDRLIRGKSNMRRKYPLHDVRRMGLSQATRVAQGLPPCVHPLVVTPGPGKHYTGGRGHLIIVAGHLRHAGNCWLKDRAPALNCIVREYKSDQDMLADMSAENGIRTDPGPLDWATLYQREIDGGQKTLRQLVRESGKSPQTISQYLALLKLPAAVQQIIDDGRLPLGAIKLLLGLESPGMQITAARKAVERGYSLHQLQLHCSLVGKRIAAGSHRKSAAPDATAVPATDGLPANSKADWPDLRFAAASYCSRCDVNARLGAKEPAWHLATAAAGQVCTDCDLRGIRGSCAGCPLPAVLSAALRQAVKK